MPKHEALPKLYTLKDRQVVEATIEEWGRDLANPDRIVAAWTFKEKGLVKGLVSTVFLGVDHRLGDGPPLVFETMVFGGPLDRHQERCSTWAEAEAQHERVCAMVRQGAAAASPESS